MTPLHHAFQSSLKIFFSIYLLFSTALLWADSSQKQDIQVPVDELHDALISIMKSANTSSFEDRYAQLEKVISNSFNTPLISRVVLSRYWKSLDDKSQTDFIALFDKLTISTYVSRFDSYGNESFKNIDIEPMKKDRYLVKTELIQTNDDPVSFNYIVQNDDGHWKIISVIANGINDLSLKRAEYSSVIKDQGFEALVDSIKEKISDLQPKTGQ
jgi:phospholipid transport system substrate-binding protein